MKWRILIVDDEPDIRTIIRATLSAKYEVIEAGDGLDALQKLEIAEPDFVLLDVMMPLMDGFQTCDAIRTHPRFSHLPVMFLSALNKREDMEKGYATGADLYLTKPFDPARLLRNVDVFFETTPPPRTGKRYTIEKLKELEQQGAHAIAHAESQAAHYMHPEHQKKAVMPTMLFGAQPEPPAASPAPPKPAAPPSSPRAPHRETEPADPREAKPWYEGRTIAHEAQTPTSPTASAAQSGAKGADSSPQDVRASGSSGRMAPAQPTMPRVMVVDDDAELLDFVRLAFSADYETVTASNGIEAIEKITSYQPDMIVLDAMMPKMSGYQLCQSLRRNARFGKTPIVFISGRATQRDKDYAMRMGANDFVAKPFDPEDLKQRLKKIQSAPDFHILPKLLAYEQLKQDESRRKKELETRTDHFHRKEESELEKFLRENA